MAGFQNSLSSCTNCYNTGSLVALSDKGNAVGSNENPNGVVNCYGQNNTGADTTTVGGVTTADDGSTLMTTTGMTTGSDLAEKLNVNTHVWSQDGDYPTLTVGTETEGVSYTVCAIHPANKTTYVVDESFNTNGLVVGALYDNGYTVLLSSYTYTPDGALTEDDKTISVQATYNNETYSFSFSITVYVTLDAYLDGTADSNGNGTAASPFNSLESALDLVSKTGGKIVVVGTVTITGGNYYDSVTYERGGTFDGPMFRIDAPNNSYGIAYVTFTSATFDGNNKDAIFEVVQGRLRLRGNVKLQNADIGVEVNAKTLTTGLAQAQVEVNYAKIGTVVAVKLTGETTVLGTGDDAIATNTMILNSFGSNDVTLDGVVSLAQGAYITVYNAITCDMTVECANPAAGTQVATGVVPGGTSYPLTSDDAAKVSYVCGAGYSVVLSTENNNLTLEYTPVYLNGTAATGGTGTMESPYNNLTDAITDARTKGCLIIVTGTTTIDASATYDDQVTIQRGSGFTGNMFVVNAPSSSVITMGGMTIDGGNTGTIITVSQGQLKLTDGIKVENGSTAIDLTGSGQLEVDDATISGSLYGVKVGSASNTFILNCGEDEHVSITRDIYLGTGATITVNAGIHDDLTVECEAASAGLTIATAGNGYTLTQHDADYITYINHAYGVVKKSDTNALTLANIRYLDGTASGDGTGTQASPYNNLTSALNAVGENDMIVVLGTVAVTSGTYDKAVTIQRDETLSDAMFDVRPGLRGSVTLSSMVITGRGTGTNVTQTNGSLTLDGGVTLANCDIAVDAVGGTLYYSKAVVEGQQYSLRIGAATGNCYLQLASPMSASSITGTVYLGSDRMLVIPRGYNIYGITGYITLVCQDPYIGRRVVSMDGSIYGQQDMAKVRYEDGAYSLVLNGTTRIDLAAAT
jgi:hypothetical protein